MSKTMKSYRFDDHTLELIEQLRVELNLSNNSEVLRRSITLLKLAVDNQAKGGAVMLKNADTQREILL